MSTSGRTETKALTPLGLQELLSDSSLGGCAPRSRDTWGAPPLTRCPACPTEADAHHLTARFCTSPFLSSRSLSSIFTTLRSLSSSSWMESFCSSDMRSLVAMNLSGEGTGGLPSSSELLQKQTLIQRLKGVRLCGLWARSGYPKETRVGDTNCHTVADEVWFHILPKRLGLQS